MASLTGPGNTTQTTQDYTLAKGTELGSPSSGGSSEIGFPSSSSVFRYLKIKRGNFMSNYNESAIISKGCETALLPGSKCY